MSERLQRQNLILAIVIKVLKTLGVLHLLEGLHLSHENKIFYSHPETILAVAGKIAGNDRIWRMLENNPAFRRENKKGHFRTKLQQLLKESR